MKKHISISIFALFTLVGSAQTLKDVQFDWNFESGFGGDFQYDSFLNIWKMSIDGDNGSTDLPASYKRTYFFRASNAAGILLRIAIEDVYWSCGNIPVASFDGEEWFRLDPKSNSDSYLEIQVPDDRDELYISYFYPYTVSQKNQFLDSIRTSSLVEISTLGEVEKATQVPEWARTIELVTLSRVDSPVQPKKKIWIHARIHPGEIPPSYCVEGLVKWLITSKSAEADWLLDHCIFYIIPMANPTGVYLGNYRTNWNNENLESPWCASPEIDDINPYEEVQLLKEALDQVNQEGAPMSLALNLHASMTAPTEGHFHFKHLSPSVSPDFEAIEDYWIKRFDTRATQFNDNNPQHSQLSQCAFVESYLWNHYSEEVMALTLELVYLNRDSDDGFATPDDFRQLGAEMAMSVYDYFNPTKFYLDHEKSSDSLLTLFGGKYDAEVEIMDETGTTLQPLPAWAREGITLPMGTAGNATVSSDHQISSYRSTGMEQHILAVEKSPQSLSQNAVLSHIPKQDWQATFIATNYSQKECELRLTPDGKTESMKTVSVSPGSTFHQSVRDLGSEWLTIESDQQVWNFQVNYTRAGQQSSTLELKSQPDTQVFFPHIPQDRDHFWFGFVLLNLQVEAITYQMDAYQSDGSITATRVQTLAPNEKQVSLLAEFWPDLPTETSWISITSPSPLEGLMLFGTQNGQSLAGLPLSGQRGSHFQFAQLIDRADFWHGLAMVNTNQKDSQIQFTLYDDQGGEIDQWTETLQAGERATWLLSQMGNQKSSSAAWARLDCSTPCLALELLGDTDFFSLEGFLLPTLENRPRNTQQKRGIILDETEIKN